MGIEAPIATLWNPDTCPAAILPWLAWALSVDNWDSGWSDDAKRESLRKSVSIHRVKGTVASIKLALAAAGYLIDPWVKVWDTVTDVEIVRPASARVAGVIAKSDAERGFWHSPSNRIIDGITGTARAIDFTLGDATSRADPLVAAGGQINALGFRIGVSGLWSITSARHMISGGGFTTAIKTEKPKQ